MDEFSARMELERLIAARGEDYASLSRLIGRNAAYVQQYIKRGSPRRLAEQDRRVLARYFGVDERALGGAGASAANAHVAISRLDVAAAAGAGAVGTSERAVSQLAFDPIFLRRLGVGDPALLSVIRVEGDSMAPTLSDGDEILVDGGDAGERLRDGIYVLRRDDALMVKRLAPDPSGGRVAIRSDNDHYPSWPDCALSAIVIVGRVLWCGRRLA